MITVPNVQTDQKSMKIHLSTTSEINNIIIDLLCVTPQLKKLVEVQ